MHVYAQARMSILSQRVNFQASDAKQTNKHNIHPVPIEINPQQVQTPNAHKDHNIQTQDASKKNM